MYRKALAKLRCSAHRLNVEVSRYKGEDDDSLCNYCLSLGIYVLEDEYHFIMECPKYKNLNLIFRTQYILVDHINIHFFNQLMSSKYKTVLCNLSKFVYHAFLLRENRSD